MENKFRTFAKDKNIYFLHLKLRDLCLQKKHKQIRQYSKELGIDTRLANKNIDSETLCYKILDKLDLLSTRYPDINICNKQILELSLHRKPTISTFPNWAIFTINGTCFNIFDLQYLITKKKVNLSPCIERHIHSKLQFILDHFNHEDKLVKLFLERQSSVPENSYNFQPILMLLREQTKSSPTVPILPIKSNKKSSSNKYVKRSSNIKFTFKKNFISKYYDLPIRQTRTNMDNVISNVTDDISLKNINLCKKFVRDLCSSTSRHVYKNEMNIQIKKEDLKQPHYSDDGSFNIITLGFTSIKCDKKSAYDPSHNCSFITIKELPIHMFRKTLVHELLHSEIHERRVHPLQLQTQRSMSQSEKFEEGICVLAEFLASGLGFNSNEKEFTRTKSTDEYMQKLLCETYIDTFGNEIGLQPNTCKFEFQKKYCSGFAIALQSMVKNNLTFLELLNYFIIHGVFPQDPTS